MTKIFDLAAGAPWAIYEPALETILQIAGRDDVDQDTLAEWKSDTERAVDGRPGEILPGTRTVRLRGRAAVVPVAGPMFRHANLLTMLSGATTYEALSAEITTALDSPDVETLVLDIDSPGGEIAGVTDVAALIAGADKPTVAYVDHMAASAAYWIASAADEIVTAPIGMLGSIGVVSTWRDTSERDKKSGVQDIEVVSSQSPDKRMDPSTEEGRAKVQATVDRLADEFIAAVAAQRDVPRETVLAAFGRGGIRIGSDAVAVGMADRVAGFEEMIAGIAGGEWGGDDARPFLAEKKGDTMSHKQTAPAAEEKPEITAEVLKQNHADLVAAFKAEGHTEGVEAERARILGIEANAMPGHEKLVADMKADGKTTPEQAAVRILAAEKENRGKQLQAMADTDQAVQVAAAPTATGTGDAEAAARTPAEKRRAAWDKDADLQAEFGGDFAAYEAFCDAEDNGQARILNR